MLTTVLLYGLFIVCVTQSIFANALHRYKEFDDPRLRSGNGAKVQQFVKASERSIRSIVCDNTTESTPLEATYGNDINITCACKGLGTVQWYNAQCEKMDGSARIEVRASFLYIKKYNINDSMSYECKLYGSSGQICAAKTDITVVAPVPAGKAGVIVFLVFLALALVVMLCCCRKYRTRISLCIRDTCKPSDANDGKVYDAYVSIGVTETDRRFVESFVYDALQKKYGYSLLVDDKNLLPKLDYSDKLQSNLHKCRRLIVVFSPTYMTHDWCMYCFNEGLRKIVDLNVPTIFVVTDFSIMSELRSHSDIIAHIPQIILAQHLSSAEKQHAIERIRQKMSPPSRTSHVASFRKKSGLRSPMLSDAESIHKSDTNVNGNGGHIYTGTETEYTFGTPPEKIAEEIQREYDEALEEPGPDEYVTAVREGEDIDPDRVKVHQYGARKDFYSLTMPGEDI